MLFSERFSIKRDERDSWFDPLLAFDTKLFIDPFLVFKYGTPPFDNAHEKLVKFFNIVFKLIASSGGEPTRSNYLKALDLLLFPEVAELRLGYTKGGIEGLGSAKIFAKSMADAVWNSIERGIEKIEHFEELSIFSEGIGADRISDMAANILKSELISFTQGVCKRHNITQVPTRLRHSSFSFKFIKWLDSEVCKLPINPDDQKPILLVPEKFLNTLPTINPHDFWDYIFVCENERLRRELSWEIKRRVDKKTIVSIARRAPDLVEKYIAWAEEKRGTPYNLTKDPKFLHKWYQSGVRYAEDNPLKLGPPKNHKEFLDLIQRIIKEYRLFVELRGGCKLLWNDDGSSRGETAGQLLLLAVASQYARDNNFDISKEVNIGRGPVDFKFSNGFFRKVVIEVKLSKSSRFWHGLEKQLPEYLKAEDVQDGIYLVIGLRDIDFKNRIPKIERILKEVEEKTKKNIQCVVVDARPSKPPASKL